jgi:hypothetical protein
MCLVEGMLGATAATAAAVSATTGVVMSATSMALGIVQAQKSANMQVNMATQQQELASRQSQQQAFAERNQQVQRHKAEIAAQQTQVNQYYKQATSINQAANASFTAEQVKLNEARQKTLFERQNLLAKSIGAKGAILATGATGQSVGLLMNDADRQYGFAAAQQDASLASAIQQAGVSIDQIGIQQQSSLNQAASQVAAPVQAPQFAATPVGIGKDLGLGIPSYGWT